MYLHHGFGFFHERFGRIRVLVVGTDKNEFAIFLACQQWVLPWKEMKKKEKKDDYEEVDEIAMWVIFFSKKSEELVKIQRRRESGKETSVDKK